MIHKLHQWFLEYKILFFLLLFIQNIAIFWQHYFNNVGFPGDFAMTYYAWPAFWTTSVNVGIFPQWVPYEGMGYPLAMNIQSGVYYPIFWIFPLLHLSYTLYDAVILQVLTIFFGSIGMFLLLNLIFKSSRYAFIGAVAFQFFGGFYSLGQAPDIVRAFAIAPWLFYVFRLNIDKPKITRRILFIPIVIYFLATGGYPGIFVSSLFIITIFLSLQIVNGYFRYLKDAVKKLRSLKVGGAMFGLMILGISISIINLGPAWQERNELTRFHGNPFQDPLYIFGLRLASVPVKDFSLLFLSSSPLPLQDQPWKSIFVSLPLLIFASFIPISALKKYWMYIAIMVLSILMVGGLYSPFWQAITSAVPALKLSRFPSSDYRVFIAIPLIILGTAGLKAIIESKLSWKKFGARGAFVVTWFSLGVYSLYSNLNLARLFVPWQNACVTCPTGQLFINFQIASAVLILVATISIIIYYMNKNKIMHYLSSVNNAGQLSKLGLLVIALLISADGIRYILDMELLWISKPFNLLYLVFRMPLEKNGKLITFSLFENIPNERPARETTDNVLHFSWKGYLQGNYMMNDYTSVVLTPRSIVESNDAYRHYMFMKWTPLLVEPNLNRSSSQSTAITLPVNTFSNKQLLQTQSHSTDQVIQTRYGINDITYKVTLKEPKLMVENEIYFPGWEADFIFPNKVVRLQASVVNGAFRAWPLPAGNYEMIAHFHFPNLIIYQSISIISFAVWILIIAKYWRKTKTLAKGSYSVIR